MTNASAITKHKKLVSSLTKEMSSCQQKAFYEIIEFIGSSDKSNYVLSGYAGTGKTWLIGRIVQYALKKNLKIAVCAPTNQAVSVIMKTLTSQVNDFAVQKVYSATLHALLGVRLRESDFGNFIQFLKRSGNKKYIEDFDLVIIDESSMISKTFLDYILDEQKKQSFKVLFVMDSAQLMPIETQDESSEQNQKNDPQRFQCEKMPPVISEGFWASELQTIVRQKSTGTPHPIAILANYLREQYIDSKPNNVLDPPALMSFIESNADILEGKVRTASVNQISQGIVSLRTRKPQFDIRAIAFRNKLVDQHNAYVHRNLADHYHVDPSKINDPFWPGEIMIAREQFYAFHRDSSPEIMETEGWIETFSPDNDGNKDETQKSDQYRPEIESIFNNSEMTIISCDPCQHPFLGIDAWKIIASLDKTTTKAVQFYIADNKQEFEKIKKNVWNHYRNETDPAKKKQEFKRAWAITRSCAPTLHAYAMTAHKSQGSTFDVSIIDVPDLFKIAYVSDMDDYYRALYVALTRAREAVWLCF